MIFYHTVWEDFFTNSAGCEGLDVQEICEESANMCEALFITGYGSNCENHCKSLGFVGCEEGWDEKGSDCASKWINDPRKSGNGCRMSYNNQICRCSNGKQILLGYDQQSI